MRCTMCCQEPQMACMKVPALPDEAATPAAADACVCEMLIGKHDGHKQPV